MKIFISFFLLISIVILLLTFIYKITSYNMKLMNNKSSTFECGFDIMSNLRLPFSLNFYIISIIFLIFDVELILLMPFVFMMKTMESMTMSTMMVMFFMILMLGFVYEWWMGLLNWLI
uniref:NADH-ubiquinone oxidoreductase chain 3 n=1 Tax=Pealius mori TaxID=1453199 RepID=A0A7G2CTJ5_9HEMI|nr:NADH dehydrogenase subunit 3 [Pealius mori]WPM91805.1 NADH dehydrogenase subunit 3 [Pealius mori]CAD5105722.1 NADH dehydrogenase subunit 3 [Pealius mori]